MQAADTGHGGPEGDEDERRSRPGVVLAVAVAVPMVGTAGVWARPMARLMSAVGGPLALALLCLLLFGAFVLCALTALWAVDRVSRALRRPRRRESGP
ncbi:hypothetical protein [Streptomyces lichenis]|uniref:Uncharacterized protein n=1 Tax=Streptomyces lichenis TaxID=2306967 RepID=A0ABT0I8U6_9ACTN|nr:hypothetical protein [Streptomyces lichenis]MCK8677751.1 hypothetical protein [Streptomyces lichenis]